MLRRIAEPCMSRRTLWWNSVGKCLSSLPDNTDVLYGEAEGSRTNTIGETKNAEKLSAGSAADLLRFLEEQGAFEDVQKRRRKHISSHNKMPGRWDKRDHRKKTNVPAPYRTEIQRLLFQHIDQISRKAYRFMYDGDVTREEKLAIGKSAIHQLAVLAENPLSLSNSANIMYSAVRLRLLCVAFKDHARGRNVLEKKSEPNLGQNELIKDLFHRFMELLRKENMTPNNFRQRTALARTLSSALYVCSLSPSSLDVQRLDNSSIISDISKDAHNQHLSCWEWNNDSNSSKHSITKDGVIEVNTEDIDLICSKLLSLEKSWNKETVINTAGALGRMRVLPIEGKLHEALCAAATPLIPELGPKIATILWGFSCSGYHPGVAFLHESLAQVSKEQDALGNWSQAAIDSLLYSLVNFGYLPWIPFKYDAVSNSSVDKKSLIGKKSDPSCDVVRNDIRSLLAIGKNQKNSLQYLPNDSTATREPAMKDTSSQARTRASNSIDYLAERAVLARAERARLAFILKETDNVLEKIEGGAKSFEQPKNFQPDVNGVVPSSEDKDLSTLDLVALLLNESKLAKEGLINSDKVYSHDDVDDDIVFTDEVERLEHDRTSGRMMPHVFDVGGIVVEKLIQPDTGRVIISPYYDFDIIGFQRKNFLGIEIDSNVKIEGENFHISSKGDEVASISTVQQDPPSNQKNSLNSTGKIFRMENTTFGDDNIMLEDDKNHLHGRDTGRNIGETAAAAISALILHGLHSAKNPQTIAKLVWYSGVLRHYNAEFFEIASSMLLADKQFLQKLGSMPLASVDLLQGFAQHSEPIPQKIADTIVFSIERGVEENKIPVHSLSWLAWSLASTGQLNESTFRRLASTIESSQAFLKGMQRRHLSMLFQAALQLETSTKVSHRNLLPDKLLEEAQKAWHKRGNRVNTSAMQRQVADVVKSLGIQCELEYQPPDSHVVIDIAIENVHPEDVCSFARSKTYLRKFNKNTTITRRKKSSTGNIGINIALEVDGPFHYATNIPNRPMGALVLRNSLLEHSGWSVLSIPYWEWEQVGNTRREKQEYLRTKILQHLSNFLRTDEKLNE